MRAPSGNDYEKVKIGEFITGIIDEVCYEENHEFSYLKQVTKSLGIRFKLLLEGCEHPKYTKWQKFNLGARSNLYKRYVSQLVAGATPNMDFDLDELQGLQVQTYWTENDKGYQNIELIKPVGDKLNVKLCSEAKDVPEEEQKEIEKEIENEKVEETEKEAKESVDKQSAPDDNVDFSDLP